MVYGMGYRYRLHRKDLPGKPDLVFASRRKIILVHGCFWHCHPDCRDGRLPKSNTDYWGPKLARNRERDKENCAALDKAGWSVLTVWECETADEEVLKATLAGFLNA